MIYDINLLTIRGMIHQVVFLWLINQVLKYVASHPMVSSLLHPSEKNCPYEKTIYNQGSNHQVIPSGNLT